MARRSWFRSFSSDIKEHPLLWAFFALGFAVGILFRAPLLPPLQDGAANVIGAGIGAVLAVSGAAYIANGGDRRRYNTMAAVLLVSIAEIIGNIENTLKLAEQLDKEIDMTISMKIRDTYRLVLLLVNAAGRTESRLEIFAASSVGISPLLTIGAVDALGSLRRHKPMLTDLLEVTDSDPNQILSAETSASKYFEDRLRPLMRELEGASEILK